MLKKAEGNMYEFITQTWNPITGECPHDCKYCYAMYKYNQTIKDGIRLREESFRNDFKTGNFIFVGSGIDVFADEIPHTWIKRILDYCGQDNIDLFGARNRFLFQTKNPQRLLQYIDYPVFLSSVICTTIESNRFYPSIMNNAPKVEERAKAMNEIANRGIQTYLTIEPIMAFDENELVSLIKMCKPVQVNIGANTNENICLPEPTQTDIASLIQRVENDCKVEIKRNLSRLVE